MKATDRQVTSVATMHSLAGRTSPDRIGFMQNRFTVQIANSWSVI